MEELDNDVPLPKPEIGIVFNLKSGKDKRTADAEAEYDSIDTVNAIKKVFEDNGLKVRLIEATQDFSSAIAKNRPDMVFNIAEGIGGRGREAQVPSVLEMLGIPFTGSDSTALSVALDKNMTKKLLSAYGIRSPKGITISSLTGWSVRGLKFPLIVKPNAEGSSKGIPDKCVVNDRAELKEAVKRDLALYGGSILAEEYIEGREFTVGIIGNGEDTKVFPPMEIVFKRLPPEGHAVYSFDVKQNYKKYIEYSCPSSIDKSIESKMVAYASKAYAALGCRDFTRADFRVAADGTVYFIEINPLPGLAPGYSDYPMLADFSGVPYEKLVMSVLEAGAKRCGVRLDGRSSK